MEHPRPLRNRRANTSIGYEEDSDSFNNTVSDEQSIVQEITKCPNEDFINLKPYNINNDDIFTLYSLNSNNKFNIAICVSKTDMKEYLVSQDLKSPSLITTIWKDGDINGLGGKPTCKFLIKMPPNNIFITLGSFDRMMNSTNKNWYLLPLYGGKKRRIGYSFGISQNHGQIPGFIIYKAFTKDEIKSRVQVQETDSDYPLYTMNMTLDDLSNHTLLIKNIVNHFDNHFINFSQINIH